MVVGASCGLAVVRVVWRWAPRLCGPCEVLGLLLLPGAAGCSLGERCSLPGGLQHWGVSERLYLFVYGRRGALSTARVRTKLV